jgi:hypothetical protein
MTNIDGKFYRKCDELMKDLPKPTSDYNREEIDRMNIYECIDILMDDHASKKIKSDALKRAKEWLRENPDEDGVIGSSSKLKISEKVREFLITYEDQSQSIQANKILDVIDKIVKQFNNIELPEIEYFVDDENSLNLQWDIGDSTLIFDFETEPRNTFWVLLSGEDDRDIRAKGNLDKYDILIPWLINIIKRKSMFSGKQ